jgi:glycosyltransferase involved in cell wall biosynthesis
LLELTAPGAPGIMHWTYPLPIKLAGWTNVYTIHDAIALRHPDLTPIDGQRQRRMVGAILEADGHILTVSRASRDHIIESFGCPSDRVTACHPGLELGVRSEDLPPDLVPDHYFVAVGSVEPRKNLVRLAEAYRLSGTRYPLVVVGPSGWRSEEIEAALQRCPGLRRLHYVSRPSLIALVAGARALLFPSLAEGFGLPIAEAMALGTPVMTSRGGATEEVAGNAALLVDPHDTANMTRSMKMLADDSDVRTELQAKGRAHAAMFTMDAFASRLGAFYRALVQDRLAKPDQFR